MTKLIVEVTKTQKGTYYNFFVVLSDGSRVQIKPRFDNQVLQLYLLADEVINK